ncbi:hypothetical protein [Paludisphaera mucosa]|uniref:General stress protein CsbD n=1 Tax=Paludisphaera mucosa TaxID=3030827 RepID=A0ABT6FBC8_9BACT|nr:hypothetical protein [Paludisphaera mucosa]MDG3004693.1 hypothetical protein [Paludisphaera mucosa]
MSSHSARIQHALRDLREKWAVTTDAWADQVARDYEKNHIAPVEGLVKRTMVGMDKLSESLTKIRKALEENG